MFVERDYWRSWCSGVVYGYFLKVLDMKLCM